VVLGRHEDLRPRRALENGRGPPLVALGQGKKALSTVAAPQHPRVCSNGGHHGQPQPCRWPQLPLSNDVVKAEHSKVLALVEIKKYKRDHALVQGIHCL
jgi:hypothetical protein